MRKNVLRRQVRGVLESSQRALQLWSSTGPTPGAVLTLKIEKNEKNQKNPHFFVVPSEEIFFFVGSI